MKAFSSADGELITKTEVATDDLVPMPLGSAMLLTTKEGYLVRAPWVVAGTQRASFSLGKSTIKLGQHPIARQLRAIGVGLYPSVGKIRGEHLQFSLSAGTCEPLPSPGSN